MYRLIIFFPWLLLTTGCSSHNAWPLPSGSARGHSSALLHTPASRPAVFSFDWRLSGDRPAAPLQVFDDGNHTWLQFPEGMPVPAILASTAAGDELLSTTRQGAYVRLNGVWPLLRLRAGHLQVLAERLAPTAAAPDTSPAPPGLPAAAADQVSALSGETRASSLSTSQQPPPSQPAVTSIYEVSLADRNMRLALGRWADLAGWTFQPEHWAVDVDIPLAGSARFDVDFKSAVRQLLAATEMSDRPLQPCFYANNVLRVIPLTQRCDRTSAVGKSS